MDRSVRFQYSPDHRHYDSGGWHQHDYGTTGSHTGKNPYDWYSKSPWIEQLEYTQSIPVQCCISYWNRSLLEKFDWAWAYLVAGSVQIIQVPQSRGILYRLYTGSYQYVPYSNAQYWCIYPVFTYAIDPFPHHQQYQSGNSH